MADGPPPAPTDIKGERNEASGPRATKGNEASEPRATGADSKEEKGWTTVERKRRDGAAKKERREIVDDRGVTTFWSTPDGLYDCWRPYQHQGQVSRGGCGGEGDHVARVRCFVFALVGSGTASG